MNILFIEDEKDLAVTAIAQLELKGYTVFPAYDIAGAQAVLDDPERRVDFIIADHRLPDGMGIQFLIEIKQSFPQCKCAIVSACLTDQNIETLQALKIPYYHKPLLYGKVIDELRRELSVRAKVYQKPENLMSEAFEEIPVAENQKLWPFK
jgi:DNA-binding NtrC family response regulator